jgi:Zn-dependent protease with chaperone function
MYTSHDDKHTVLSPIILHDSYTGQTEKRTVWHPENIDQVLIPKGLYHYSPKTTFASEKNFQKVSLMQKMAGINKKPLILFEDSTLSNCFTRPEFDDFYTITARQNLLNSNDEDERTFTFGHELGHHVVHQYKTDKKNHIYSLYDISLRAQYLGGAALGIALGKAAQNDVHPSTSAIIIPSTLLYLYSRKLATPASWKSCNEELFCDRFAVETFGNNAASKIAIAKGGLQCLHSNSYVYRIMEELNNIIIPSTHPTTTTRIQQLETLVSPYQHQNSHNAKL